MMWVLYRSVRVLFRGQGRRHLSCRRAVWKDGRKAVLLLSAYTNSRLYSAARDGQKEQKHHAPYHQLSNIPEVERKPPGH